MSLRLQVLKMYKKLLQVSAGQPEAVKQSLISQIKSEFRSKSASIDPKNIQLIEYQLRLAQKRLDFLNEHRISGFKVQR